jgi:phage gpG-like protein
VSDVKVTINMFGNELFARKLRSASRRALDFSPILNKIAIKWTARIEEQFATEGVRLNGIRWASLSFKTVKGRGGSAHPILFDSGDLFDGMTSASNMRVSDHGITLNPGPYAEEIGGYHQTGTTSMPQRKIVNFTPEDRRDDLDEIGDWLFGSGRGRRL